MDRFDLLVIGGGINGAAIARDAAGRGLDVLLVEKDDLAAHTSSASSKLAHGGLRYLERFEFRLVREALAEREVLLRTAPHLVRPLRFILPQAEGMRPRWMVRLGLLLYDLLALRGSLPRSRSVRSGDEAVRSPLSGDRRLLSYWDAWVDDSRLVALNAVDAAERGAEIATRTEFLSARRQGDCWLAELSGGRTVAAAAIVNAAGPWVGEVLATRLREDSGSRARLVKGSHIIVPKLFDGEHGYILQQPDGRVVFALPFEAATLVGTTDIPADSPGDSRITAGETDYLCAAANLYFVRQTAPSDLLWSFAGIRALYDDGAPDAQSVTRDYRLELDGDPGPKLLSVFGGKITTARALASEALDRLEVGGLKFTRTTPLPGGDILPLFLAWLDEVAAWMPGPLLGRLSRAYGTRMRDAIGDARSLNGLGRHFGAGLYEAEVRYLRDKEFARTADDILWRRSKLGLHMSAAERQELERYLSEAVMPAKAGIPGPAG
ncbi:glycerol-3-phosphate dehydrogenase [Allosphingosinicella sp.]|jgi:glycerol-3-phosphate dehydrogenase|uniref:glycerol-3-phosphate dehydrogenase n=1 Tax=Allosphingosinicella sp. TaxID=2823234 RepID=UPI002EDF033D